MNKENVTPETPMTHITYEQAKKSISEMNLINGFLFDSTLEQEEEAKIVMGNILKAIFFRDFEIKSVVSQKALNAIDTRYHGIRLDVHISEKSKDEPPIATIYDVEMEDRVADKKFLPKRLRFYGALHDVKKLEPSAEYDKLPNFVSIVILSYDPFDAGDMYYEAKTVLITHPGITYENGIKNIFLYCHGKPNFDDPEGSITLPPEHGKKLKEMLKYIVSGEKPAYSNSDIDAIDAIVTKVKSREEVTTEYMRQWDRELSIKRETRKEDAIKDVLFDRDNGIPDDIIRSRLEQNYEYDDETINELFEEVNNESVITQ